ncbi:MAG TPA: MFS transporter, partial [Tahibacter sp.]|nr:MFS transporter [Tahibacter sp.]
MPRADTPSTRLATRVGFFVAGFGIACWAPLVPFAKARLGIDDGMLGLLLLCLGIGSVAAMLAAGMLSARFGARPVVVASGFGLAATLPLLAAAPTPLALGAALFLFGASLGSLDVAINIHAVEVERDARQPLMSGFHAQFSVGGFAGAAAMTALLSLGLGPFASALAGALPCAFATAVAAPRLLRTK